MILAGTVAPADAFCLLDAAVRYTAHLEDAFIDSFDKDATIPGRRGFHNDIPLVGLDETPWDNVRTSMIV